MYWWCLLILNKSNRESLQVKHTCLLCTLIVPTPNIAWTGHRHQNNWRFTMTWEAGWRYGIMSTVPYDLWTAKNIQTNNLISENILSFHQFNRPPVSLWTVNCFDVYEHGWTWYETGFVGHVVFQGEAVEDFAGSYMLSTTSLLFQLAT